MSETGPSVSVAQVDTVLALGRRMHIAGGFAVAERAYRQVLEASPDHPEALRCMGQLAFQTGRGAEALEFLNRSVAARPGDSATRCDLSRVCLGLGMASEAAAHARVALAFSPALFEAHATLADALRQGGRWEEAIGHYLEILRSAPEEVGALLGLGFCLLSVDRNEEAEAVIATAERLAPEQPEALHLRGVVRHRMGKPEEALPWLMRARALDPANARIAVSLAMAQDGCTRCEDALATLRLVEEGNGNDPEFLSAVCHVLIGLNRLDEAEDYGRRALALDPNSANACNSMGRICDALWRLEEAEAFFRRVLELRNGSGLELTNLSKVLLAQGRMEESMLLAERAYELYPKHIRVQFNLAMRLLRSGDLTRGWEMYEVSKAKGGARVPSWDVDLPDLEVDEDPGDMTVLVRGEQGIGDIILFLSVLPDLIARARHCIIEGVPKINPLLKRSFPTATVVTMDELYAMRDRVPADRQMLVGSLCRRYRMSLDAFPNPHRYFIPDPARVENFRRRLGEGVRLALVWRGRSRFDEPSNMPFYLNLEQLAPVLKLPGLTIVSAQYDASGNDAREEIEEAKSRFGVDIRVFDDLDTYNDLDGVAALLEACDVVLGPPTTTLHIAGALGKPTLRWCASPEYFNLNQTYSPFTPSVRNVVPETLYDKEEIVRLLLERLPAFIAEHAGRSGGR